jgi:hypothetical protein
LLQQRAVAEGFRELDNYDKSDIFAAAQAQLVISEEVRRSLDVTMSRVEDLGPIELKGQPNSARIFKVA